MLRIITGSQLWRSSTFITGCYRVKPSTINGVVQGWSDGRKEEKKRANWFLINYLICLTIYLILMNFITIRREFFFFFLLNMDIMEFMNDVLENYGKEFICKKNSRREVVKFFEMDTNFSWSTCQCSISSEQIKWIEAGLNRDRKRCMGSLQRPLFRSKKKKEKKQKWCLDSLENRIKSSYD